MEINNDRKNKLKAAVEQLINSEDYEAAKGFILDSIKQDNESIDLINHLEMMYYLNRDVTQAIKLKDFIQHLSKEILEIQSQAVRNQQKNLIVFHLESVSHEIYYRQFKYLDNLRRLMDRSVKLSKFFSSATSSIIALTDFLHGNDFELDDCISFDYLHPPINLQENLFDILSQNGYETLGIGFPLIWRDDVNIFNIWSGKGGVYQWKDKYDDFIASIEDVITKHTKPFALHIWDLRSHLVYTDAHKSKGNTSLEKISRGYKCIDETIRRIIDLLEENKLMDSTVIVGYGDHGDELWTHALNGGFCHVIDPYSNMIHTPAFIYSKELTPLSIDTPVSLIDLKNTILYLLHLKEDDTFQFGGKNIFKYANTQVFSRNLFANQEDTSKSQALMLTKAYSVCNEKYNLLISRFGLEMYAYEMDETNHSNLLSFFELAPQEVLKFDNRGDVHFHFKVIMNREFIEDIIKNYEDLFNELKNRVAIKNAFYQDEMINMFDMDSFKKIRAREYRW